MNYSYNGRQSNKMDGISAIQSNEYLQNKCMQILYYWTFRELWRGRGGGLWAYVRVCVNNNNNNNDDSIIIIVLNRHNASKLMATDKMSNRIACEPNIER